MRKAEERATLLLLVAILLIAAGGYLERKDRIEEADRLATETHASLCALKNDIAVRKRAAEQFVQEIIDGDRKPIPGITVSDLLRSIDTQEQTLDALIGLKCNEEER